MNGTLRHPGEVGKVVVVLALAVLPSTVSPERALRLMARVALPIGFLATLLTESRANIASFVAVIAFWGLLLPGRGRVGTRVLMIGAGGLTAVAAAPTLIARFKQDPDGGQRARLMHVAMEGIPEHLWTGVGPNSYVTAFGKYDPLTASGWPVHNVFVLVLAELGVIGACFFFAPFALAVVRGVRSRNIDGARGAHARALMVSVPALYLISTTGWGLLQGAMMPLTMLVFGYLAQRCQEPDSFDLEVDASVPDLEIAP